MAKMGSFKADGFKELQKELENLQKETDGLIEACARDLAARLLAAVIKRTPVGDYSREVDVVAKRDSKNHKKGDIYKKRVNPSGKMGGTLRRGWTAKTSEEAESGKGSPQAAEVIECANGLEVSHVGDIYRIEIINPVEYASYVEFGHRQAPGRYVPALGKKLKKGWVQGRFMLTKSEKEIRDMVPKILEDKIKKLLKEYMK